MQRARPRAALLRPALPALAALALIAAAGCAGIERDEAKTTENMLSAAGFTILPADTAAKQAQVQAMKQRTLIRRTRPDGSLQFVYADAAGCRCLMVGDQQNYQQFQRISLAREQTIAMQEASLDAEEASFDWGMWGYPGW